MPTADPLPKRRFKIGAFGLSGDTVRFVATGKIGEVVGYEDGHQLKQEKGYYEGWIYSVKVGDGPWRRIPENRLVAV